MARQDGVSLKVAVQAPLFCWFLTITHDARVVTFKLTPSWGLIVKHAENKRDHSFNILYPGLLILFHAMTKSDIVELV